MHSEIMPSISLFTNVQKQTIKLIVQHARVVYYDKDTVIYDNISDEVKFFFYILNGWVKIFNMSYGGSEVITDILTDTHHFNENLIFETTDAAYSVQAITDLQVMTLPIMLLKQLVAEDHQLAINLLKESMNKQSKLAQDIEYIFMRRASQRIGYFLLRLCNREKTENLVLHLPYSKSLLATRLGIRPETFSRALAKLCQQCCIYVEDEKVYVPFLEELERYVGKDRKHITDDREQKKLCI